MSWTLFQRNPRNLGPYEVLAKIGKGTAGSVFKARHSVTGTLVAIKVLCAAEARNPIALQRFGQEFLATRSLNNPHIVRGLDFGVHGTAPYLVLEYVDGVSLANHLKTIGRMTEHEALRMTLQIAQALEHAHQRGMIHRDVNPSNILLTASGRARLTDFGLVKCLESGLNLTGTATTLGTPCFMAPEQFHDAKRIDQRCDVYGLAATLYKSLTGEGPYNSSAYGTTVRKKLNGEITAPRLLVPGLSMRLDWAILRALSVSPMMRPASCSEFVRDLIGRELPPAEPELAEPKVVEPSQIPEAERRSAIRYACRLDGLCLPVQAKDRKLWEAEVTNISASGIGLVLGRRFERGTFLELAWQPIPDDVIGNMMLRVVRTQAQDSGQWLLGCQLAKNLDDEAVRALLARGVLAHT